MECNYSVIFPEIYAIVRKFRYYADNAVNHITSGYQPNTRTLHDIRSICHLEIDGMQLFGPIRKVMNCQSLDSNVAVVTAGKMLF